MNVGESRTFNYTGGVQTFVVEEKGVYQLEVYGAEGYRFGASTQASSVGKGGYSKGYKLLAAGTVLYVVCGGSNTGYNGGGYHSEFDPPNSQTGYSVGGGATHIATVTGLLKDIGKTSFIDNGAGLIVAGGGASGGYTGAGGTGGGLTGGNGSRKQGGTQSTGYAFGQGQDADSDFDGPYLHIWGSGGGGLYGGYGTGNGNGAGGGSGYIGGVPEFDYKGNTYTPETTNGLNSGNGKAVITFVAKGGAPIFLGSSAVDAVYLGSNPIDDIALGSTPL